MSEMLDLTVKPSEPACSRTPAWQMTKYRQTRQTLAAQFSLNCWTLGLNKTSRFSVEILLSGIVDHLKDAIKKKKKNAFNHIDADQLEVWKVGDPTQRNRHYQFLTTRHACSSGIRCRVAKSPKHLGGPAPTRQSLTPKNSILRRTYRIISLDSQSKI